jgi:hypothetical protein
MRTGNLAAGSAYQSSTNRRRFAPQAALARRRPVRNSQQEQALILSFDLGSGLTLTANVELTPVKAAVK